MTHRSLHTSSRGEGSPVVLLHSGGMSSRQWKKLGDSLEPSHRVVAPDFLGSGQNPRWADSDAFDFSYDVDAVLEILEGLGEPAHVVGHSYGGLVAVTAARRAPERVRSLVAFDPVAFGVLYAAHDPEGLADLANVENPAFLDRETGGSDAWFELFVDYWNGPGAWRKMPEPARAGFLEVGRKVFYEVISLMVDRTPASAYAAINAPALFLTAEHSPAAAQRVVALLAEALPNARSARIDGAGHMGPITHAALVNQAIVAHLGSIRP